jgi:hypothetical protein
MSKRVFLTAQANAHGRLVLMLRASHRALTQTLIFFSVEAPYSAFWPSLFLRSPPIGNNLCPTSRRGLTRELRTECLAWGEFGA